MIVSVDGAELFYTTKGQGPACLFLSSIGTKPYERQTPPQLSDRFKLAYVDLRGSGRSTGDPTSLTFDVLADDLEAIRADLGAEQIMVMGHSILGLLAIEYARRRPDTVSHGSVYPLERRRAQASQRHAAHLRAERAPAVLRGAGPIRGSSDGMDDQLPEVIVIVKPLLIGAFLGCLAFFLCSEAVPEEKLDQITKGMTEAQVRELLGEPHHIRPDDPGATAFFYGGFLRGKWCTMEVFFGKDHLVTGGFHDH